MKTRRCHLIKAVPILHVSLLSRPGAGGHQTKKGEVGVGMRVGAAQPPPATTHTDGIGVVLTTSLRKISNFYCMKR